MSAASGDRAPSVDRRAVLVGGTAVGVVTLTGAGWWLTRGGDGQEPTDGPGPTTTQSLVPAAPSAERVAEIQVLGARYRELSPGDTTPAILGAALPPMPSADDVESVLADSRDEIRGQYERSEVVEIDGWRIALLEAQIAAVASLAG